jgi:hypothetical protein
MGQFAERAMLDAYGIPYDITFRRLEGEKSKAAEGVGIDVVVLRTSEAPDFFDQFYRDTDWSVSNLSSSARAEHIAYNMGSSAGYVVDEGGRSNLVICDYVLESQRPVSPAKQAYRQSSDFYADGELLLKLLVRASAEKKDLSEQDVRKFVAQLGNPNEQAGRELKKALLQKETNHHSASKSSKTQRILQG